MIAQYMGQLAMRNDDLKLRNDSENAPNDAEGRTVAERTNCAALQSYG